MRGTNLSDFQPHTITTDNEILHLSWDHRRENTAVARMRPERSAGVGHGGRVVGRIGVANMRREQCGGLTSRAPRQEERWVARWRVVPKNGGWRARSGRRRAAFGGPIGGSDLNDSQLNDMRNLRPSGNCRPDSGLVRFKRPFKKLRVGEY
jgi:hypothetical protein